MGLLLQVASVTLCAKPVLIWQCEDASSCLHLQQSRIMQHMLSADCMLWWMLLLALSVDCAVTTTSYQRWKTISSNSQCHSASSAGWFCRYISVCTGLSLIGTLLFLQRVISTSFALLPEATLCSQGQRHGALALLLQLCCTCCL